MLNIHVPEASYVAPRLRITRTMVEDFIVDPVLAAEVLFGVRMDVFQKSRLRTYWWVPNVIDSSGIGSGKTSLGVFIWANLRSIILGDQRGLVMYQNLTSGENQFWSKFHTMSSPLFQAQLGKMTKEGEATGKANTQGASCHLQHYKNGSVLMMPAPDWLRGATGRAGEDVNFVALDEWTKSDAAKKEGLSGIDEQIVARVRRYSFNQHHPVWGNHWLYTASAESPEHKSYAKVREFERKIKQGDPTYAHVSYSYKDYSDLPCGVAGKTFRQHFRNEATYENIKLMGSAQFKRQGLGLWAKETRGWYTEASVARCRELGARLGLRPETERGWMGS